MDNGEIQPKTKSRNFRVFVWVVLAAFLIGFVPMWLAARTSGQARDAAQQALRLAGIENRLAAAAIDARRGDYEPARMAASAFYTGLGDELDRTPSVFSAEQRQQLQPLLSDRDQVITLLARSDPAVAERLSDVYVTYRQVTGATFTPAR